MVDCVGGEGGAGSRGGSRDETRLVGDGCAGVGDVDYGTVGDGFKEAEEGDLVGGEARVGGGGGADVGDVDWSAGEG